MKIAKKISYIFLILIFYLKSEDNNKEEKPLLKFIPSGYIKFDAFFDSRQNIDFQDGLFLLYPKSNLNSAKDPVSCPSNEDINARPQFNMVPIQTNLGVNIIGPKIKDVNILARVEADFVGLFNMTDQFTQFNLTKTSSLFHLRKAYLNLNWPEFNLLFGQTYNPLFIPDCSPNTVSYNLGSPFETISRSIQIRYTYLKSKKLELDFTILSEAADFADNGIALANPLYLRNATQPIFNFRFKKNLNEKNIFWFCIDYKKIIPQLFSDIGCIDRTSLKSIIFATAYSHYSEKNRICIKNIYAQNGTMHGLLGGYGVWQQDPITQVQKFTNLNAYSIWLDIEHKHYNFTPGLFVGFAKNLGASESLFAFKSDLNNEIFFQTFTNEAAQEIDNVFRFSPRLIWQKNGVRFAGEIELTRASYGTLVSSGKVINHKPVTNIRLLFASYYLF